MSNPKLDRDLSYLAGWLCGMYPLGLIGALDFYLREADRKAFQALLCAIMVLTANILVVALPGQRSASAGLFILGAWLFLPPLTLYYLRTLDWPAPAPDKRGWLSMIIFLGIIGILAAIAIPAYTDMAIRSKVGGKFFVAETATEAVASHYYKNHRFPDNLEQAGFKPPSWNSIASVRVKEQGIVELVLDVEPLAGKSIVIVPSIDDRGKIVWSCMSLEIKDKYLPAKCRSVKKGQVQQ
jgi:hypothetical protein